MTTPQPGDVIAGKYRVDRVLGEGGMGVVLAATHEQLDQRVALKFLLPAVAANPELVQRFMREARAAVKIHSEHVARVLDVGAHQGAPYMVMEYLEGEDLAAALASRGALPVDQAVGHLLEACEAIAEAHSLGIVHRDLKPANLFLARRPSGRSIVKVLDFGISKAPAAGNDPNITKTAAIMGSPNYMSPEQMMSSGSVDMRSDVWSLGVVLYEMLALRLPFAGDTMPALVAAILTKLPEPIGAHRGDVPIALQDVVGRCLQKEPAHRFANVAELARALLPFGPPRCEQSVERIEHVLGQRAAVHPSSSPPPAQAPRSAGFTFAPMTSQKAPPRSRHLLVTVPLAIVAMAAIAAALFFAMRSPKPAASATSLPPGTAVSGSPTTSGVPSAALVALDPSSTPSPSVSAPAPSVATAAAPSTPRPVGHPAAPVHPSASAPAPAPTCRTVSYFDADGNKHFKQECP